MKTNRISAYLVLVIGVLAVSTASTLIRLAQAELTPLAVAAWRLTLASLILAPFALMRRRAEWGALSRRDWGLLLASGLLLAVHFAAWITSLALTSVVAAIVLVSVNPLFVGLLNYLLWREKLPRPILWGMLLALVGAVVIGLDDLGLGTHRLRGDFLALLGALTVAGYLLIGQRLRRRLSLLGYVFPVYATAALALMAFALLRATPLTGYAFHSWVWLLLLALIPQLIGHSSLNWALRDLPATYVSLSTLAEPLCSTLLAWLILSEAPPMVSFLGGVLVLLGLVLARKRVSEKNEAQRWGPVD
ncbi:MAG: DMT family transporter [Chloroflexota bacterium]|nr:DMT family transporter [Chloroflexota bacterium]